MTIGELRVHVVARGEGFPLLLLHGFGASTLLWDKVQLNLAESRQTVAIDLNGFGWTERPSDPAAYTLAGQERMILAVADRLGFERFDLAGHSYGGAIALFIASRRPERVRSLLLVDNALPSYSALRRKKIYGHRLLARWFVRTLALRPSRIRTGLEASYADDRKVTPELVRAYMERLRVEGVEDAFYGLTAPNGAAPDEVDLSQLRLPTLAVWGTEDELIPVDEARATVSQIPAARFVELPGCGHSPMEECPGAFLAAVTPFLREVDSAAVSSAAAKR